MRARLFLPLLLLLSACSGGGSSTEQVGASPAAPGLPPTVPGPGGGTTPPPAQAPYELDGTFLSLSIPGAYPSDLEVDALGSLYTVADALIPATVLGYPAGGGTQSVQIAAAHLIDDDGTQPAQAPGAYDFGGGLFGAFTGDLEIVFERWLLVTVGAGNSISTNGGTPLRLANLVVIDMQAGRVVQTVNLAWPANYTGSQSGGTPFPHIPQSLPSQVSFVPDRDLPNRGRVYVALSNGAGNSNSLSNWYPGTVQIWKADFASPQPISPDTAGRDPAHATRTFVSQHYNPVGLTQYRNGADVDYLLLTNAGSSSFDANYVAVPQSSAIVEVLDLSTRQWKPELEMDLGPILPSPQRIALGRDETGRLFGVLSSQTFSAAYLLDLSGLDNRPPTPADVGLLRTVDLTPGGSLQTGSGFHPGVGLTASARTLVVSTFFPAKLHVVALPGDIGAGPIEVDPDPFGDLLVTPSGGLGALVVPGNNVSDVYVINNGTFDATTFAPKDPAFIASLSTRDGLR
ncbi:MAG: hypothetical protein ACYTEG_04700 [Planctomycetota bacterium]|jgi:hypothetical protein